MKPNPNTMATIPTANSTRRITVTSAGTMILNHDIMHVVRE